MFIFLEQLSYTGEKRQQLRRVTQFVLLIYASAWLRALLAADAPADDLAMYKNIIRYKKYRHRRGRGGLACIAPPHMVPQATGGDVQPILSAKAGDLFSIQGVVQGGGLTMDRQCKPYTKTGRPKVQGVLTPPPSLGISTHALSI